MLLVSVWYLLHFHRKHHHIVLKFLLLFHLRLNNPLKFFYFLTNFTTLSTWLDCSNLMSTLIYCTEVKGNKSRDFTVKGNISKKRVLSIVTYVQYFLDFFHTLEMGVPCTRGMYPILMLGTYAKHSLFLRIITLLRNLKFKFNSFYNFSLSKFWIFPKPHW